MWKWGSQPGSVAVVPMGAHNGGDQVAVEQVRGGKSARANIPSGHRDGQFWVGLGGNGVPLLVIGVCGAGCHRSLGLCK